MKQTDHIRRFFEKHPNLDTPDNREIVENVNRKIDQFAHFPNLKTLERHRKFLHHREGIEYFNTIYGNVGRMAAEQHVLEDCDGYIPTAIEYYIDMVDEYGCRK